MAGHINNAYSDSQDSFMEIKLDSLTENGAIRVDPIVVNDKTDNETNIKNFYRRHQKLFSIIFKIALHLIFLIYFIFATKYYVQHSYETNIDWANGYGFLIILYVIGYFIVVYSYGTYLVPELLKNCTENILKQIQSIITSIANLSFYRFLKYAIVAVCIIGVLTFIVVDTLGHIMRLRSTAGLAVFLIIGFAFSKHRTKIRWRPVLTGLLLQFLFGIMTMRWSTGRAIFKVLGDKATTFLNFTSNGAAFIYGDILVSGYTSDTFVFPATFAFGTLPVIFFISFCVNILYYYGIMQKIVAKLGWVLGKIMGTTICESVNAAANIFLGMTESPLLLKPYLQNLTKSEMFSVMTAGFATVAGTVLAAYISFGAQANHLIVASVMSAPAALCYSKLFYPETEQSKSTLDNIEIDKGDDTSVIDAAAKGANNGIAIVTGIIANVIAFVSFVSFLDAIVNWLGILIGYDYISFEFFVAKIFTPISWLMGVPHDECYLVGDLIALKTVLNEFVAYKRLGEYKTAKLLSPRGEMIATYAICGFSNPGSIGIMIGGMSTLVPHAREKIIELSIRAFIAGAIVCFMTACIAGILVDGSEFATTFT